MSQIGIVVVNYRSEALVAAVAERYLTAGLAVVVVDNSSSYRGPGQIVTSVGNLGFGAGCNEGVAVLPGGVDVVVLHNPDVHPDPAALAALSDELERGLDVVAPRLLVNGAVRSHGFAYPSVAREVVLSWRNRAGWATPAHPDSGVVLPGGPSGRRPPGRRFGSGALLVLRRAVFEGVGGFDRDFFLYAEDLDLWERLARAGHRLGFSVDVTMRHDSATGAGEVRSVEREALRRAGIELFAEKHGLRWNTYRWVHRRLPMRAPGVDLVERVTQLWRDGLSPQAVADDLRQDLVDGRFLRPT